MEVADLLAPCTYKQWQCSIGTAKRSNYTQDLGSSHSIVGMNLSIAGDACC